MSVAASFQNGQAARAVIGQDEFSLGNAGATQTLLGGVGGLALANNRLYAADSNRLSAGPYNNRVLIFDTTQIPGPSVDPATMPSPSTSCPVCGYRAVGLIGEQDYTTNTPGRAATPSSTAGSLNHATAVATDGTVLAVADTDNNRVLIWFQIPASNTTPPNVVLGQADFTSLQSPNIINASSLKAPQGVWIQNGRLLVADTLNHRVLIWNSIPTQNNQAANVVVGQVNFTSNYAPPVSTGYPPTTAQRLYNPVSVTSDGKHMFVADLGSHRVLIWNSIPTTNTQAADVVIGQPDLTSAVPNFGTALCGISTNTRCARTLDTPRYALSDGQRLFVADGGNDRVLIFNTIPQSNGATADSVLGQPDFTSDIVTNSGSTFASTTVDNTGAVDTLPSPTSLAWDGTNLYVADPYNRRIEVFSQGDLGLPTNSVVNWASEIVRQEGLVTVTAATIAANDTATVTIASTAYTYTVKASDTANTIAQGLAAAINANNGDPNVTALYSAGTSTVYLSSKSTNLGFDAISLSATASNSTNLAVTASGGYLTAGNAATAAPGMLVEINAPSGTTFTSTSAAISNPPSTNLPTQLGDVQVLIDGQATPLVKVTPTQIVTLIPWAFSDRNSVSITVVSKPSGGSPTISTATSAYLAPANPGLFSDKTQPGPPYPAAMAMHQPGNPRSVVSVDGTIKAGDTATITIAGNRAYSYTIAASDTLATVVNNLVTKISASDPDVTAQAGNAFTRVVVIARQPSGNGIAVAASTSASASIVMTAYTTATCCNVTPFAPITVNNPAQVNETITLAGAGLGSLTTDTPTAGALFNGNTANNATQSVSATMGGTTAQVVAARLPPNSYGIYDIDMIVPPGLAANGATQVFIAQNAFISNIVTIPVGTPNGMTDPITGPAPFILCSYSISNTTKNYLADAYTGTVGVITGSGCSWTSSADQPWVTITAGNRSSGLGSVAFSIAANATGSSRTANLTIATPTGNKTVTITQAAGSTPDASAALRFVPLATPCRAADTRVQIGPILSGTSRDFAVGAACGIPAGAGAYAMNVTVVPIAKSLNYLTVWPTGNTQPFVSTLNSYDARIKANAAIIGAGSNGSVSVYATDTTQVILDVTGYFVPATTPAALAYYPLGPCRVMDTRAANGQLGSPALAANATRTIPVLSSSCGIPASAQAYSLNVTALPHASLLYLTVWPAGQAQPATSTLNSPTAATEANATIIPAGTSGSLNVFATADADLVVDINGYFAPAGGAGALSYYPLQPCRALDPRADGSFSPQSGIYNVNLVNSGCLAPSAAQAFVLNATAVPEPTLSYLTLWAGGTLPQVSTLNSYDGQVTSNLAIVPAASGSISAYATEPSFVIFDLLGYFAP